MNWQKTIKQALSYIEDNLESSISTEDVSKHVKVSHSYFLVVFQFIVGFSISNYIRNRRLSLATYDVVNTDKKILDIALQYQFKSHEVFTRQFKKTQGVTPSEARKDRLLELKTFPPLSFDFIHPMEINNMTYSYITKSFTFVGITIDTPNIQQRKRDFNNALMKMNERKLSDPLYIIRFDIEKDYKSYKLFVGYIKEKDIEGLDTLSLPETEYLSYSALTHKTGGIKVLKQGIYNEWKDFEYIYDGYHEIEYTTNNNGINQLHFLVSVE